LERRSLCHRTRPPSSLMLTIAALTSSDMDEMIENMSVEAVQEISCDQVVTRTRRGSVLGLGNVTSWTERKTSESVNYLTLFAQMIVV
jgi:hypothetical protein